MVTVEVRAGIARGPIDDIELCIVAAGEPGGCAAVRAIWADPRLGAGLARLWHGPEAPDFGAGHLRIGGEETAHALLTARRAGHHQVAHDQRRRGRIVVLA